MKVQELLMIPIGEFINMALTIQPELQTSTPINTEKIVDFAIENNMTVEAILCSVFNLLAANCEDYTEVTETTEFPSSPSDYIN